MYYKLYTDTQGYWRWTFRAANHETIAVSSESYHNKSDAQHAINIVKSSAQAPVV
ncbi:MAG: DUF1508 domain-containing protein [Pseudomonadota bacterium]